MKSDLGLPSWREICEILKIPLTPEDAVVRKCGVIYIICRFHREKTPSLKFWEESGGFQCFGCGWRGDKIKFIAHELGIEDTRDDSGPPDPALLEIIRRGMRDRADPAQLLFNNLAEKK